MKKFLVVYPNCSKGGVTTVIRNRAANNPQHEIIAVFQNDRGGRNAFIDLPNVSVRVVDQSALTGYLTYLVSVVDFEEVAVLSLPQVANALSKINGINLHYEFHSPSIEVIRRELAFLNNERVTNMFVPSQEMRSALEGKIADELLVNIGVKENLLNREIFSPVGNSASFQRRPRAEIPVVWVGRLDWQKGAYEFIYALKQTPEELTAYMVFSLESDSTKVGTFLSEVEALGLSHRVHFLMDLSQTQIAELFRSSAKQGGCFATTSNSESFGYAVLEAACTEVKVVAFELPVPVWDSLKENPNVQFVPLGDVDRFAEALKGLRSTEGHGSRSHV